MASISTGRTARRIALGLASVSFVVLSGVGGHAQEGGLFDMLFGAPRQAVAPTQAQPSYAPYAGPRRPRFGHRRERAPKTRYVALPKADDEGISGKQPVDQKAILDDPRGVLLKDHTLRAGDIVVMPSGPKVFTGAQGKSHRMSEFEDVKHSRFVDRKTRAQLVAMMVPVGAMTADQARKVMNVKLKLAPPDEVQAVEAANRSSDGERADAASPRVIAPWTTAKP